MGMESQTHREGPEERNKSIMKYDVRFVSKELEDEYNSIKNTDTVLYKSIEKSIEKLKVNRRAGQKIPVDQVSKKYVSLYGTTHFWKIKLNREWRLIYTIAGNHIRILTVILSWFTDQKKVYK